VLTGVVTPMVHRLAIGYGVLARPNSRSTRTPMPRSAAVLADPEVAALVNGAEPVEGALKGFEGESLALWRIAR
jgi:hypothetical protein